MTMSSAAIRSEGNKINLITVFTIITMIATSGVITAQKAAISRPTVVEAERFTADAERRVSDPSLRSSRADWINATYITDDTEALSADAASELTAAITELAK